KQCPARLKQTSRCAFTTPAGHGAIRNSAATSSKGCRYYAPIGSAPAAMSRRLKDAASSPSMMDTFPLHTLKNQRSAMETPSSKLQPPSLGGRCAEAQATRSRNFGTLVRGTLLRKWRLSRSEKKEDRRSTCQDR